MRNCPNGFYEWQPEDTSSIPMCKNCHYSCFTCSGPLDDQCTACWGDAIIYSPSKVSNISYFSFLFSLVMFYLSQYCDNGSSTLPDHTDILDLDKVKKN